MGDKKVLSYQHSKIVFPYLFIACIATLCWHEANASTAQSYKFLNTNISAVKIEYCKSPISEVTFSISNHRSTGETTNIIIEKKSANSHANEQLCSLVAKAIVRKRGRPVPLWVDYIGGEGRSSIYQRVDIDQDGVSDKVIQDCGSPSNGTCTLNVALSKGGNYEVTEEFFSLVTFRSKYYIVVGDTYPKKNTHRRLYSLTDSSAKLVCKSF